MEFSDLVRNRYSARAYSGRDIDPDVLNRVLEAFVLAPTAANRQPIGLVVIETAGREDELRRIYNAEWFSSQPPIVLAACLITDRCWTRSDGKAYGDVDVSIAMDHLVLAATNEGLGTCWIGAFDAVAAREILELPENVEPIVFTPLGYPSDSPRPKLRKPMDQLVHYGRW
jgi:nitroreductase